MGAGHHEHDRKGHETSNTSPGSKTEERHKTGRMDVRGLDASQSADATKNGGPEQRQHLLRQPMPRLPVKLQPTA